LKLEHCEDSMINAENTANVQIFWKLREDGGCQTIPPIGLFYPVSKFEDGVFQENFPRSIVLDIYEHIPNKNISYANAWFLIRKNEKIPLDTKFKIFDGPRCIADVISIP